MLQKLPFKLPQSVEKRQKSDSGSVSERRQSMTGLLND